MSEIKIQRNPRRGSLFGPLLLIAIGVAFLLSNLGVLEGNFWNILFRFWPVILIVIGLDTIYRREGLVGAVFLVGLGLVFLLANLGYLAVDVWRLVLQLWPLLLIAIGFDILVGRRSLIASVVGMVIILIILAGALWIMGVSPEQGALIHTQEVSHPLGDLESANLVIEASAGGLELGALKDSVNLIAGNIPTTNHRQVRTSFSQSGNQGEFQLRESGTAAYIITDSDESVWDIGITTQIPVQVFSSLGAGQLIVDLSDLDLEEFTADMGVGKMVVILPDEGDFTVNLDGAIGEIVLRVPAGTPIQINTDTVLASVDAPSYFTKTADGLQSPGDGSSTEMIIVNLELVMGSVSIEEIGS